GHARGLSGQPAPWREPPPLGATPHLGRHLPRRGLKGEPTSSRRWTRPLRAVQRDQKQSEAIAQSETGYGSRKRQDLDGAARAPRVVDPARGPVQVRGARRQVE